MKQLAIFNYSVLFAVIWMFLSCSKSEITNEIHPSQTSVVFEAEGGHAEITFSDDYWCIAAVKSSSLELDIAGSIYDKNDSLVRSNTSLKLDGLGRLKSQFSDRGFTITRSSELSLRIETDENFRDTPFEFSIMLQSGDVYKEIFVRQVASAGYQFENIEYFVGEDDGDSIYTKKEYGHTYITPYDETTEFGVFVAVSRSVRFNYKESDIFQLVEDEQPLVKIPVGFEGQTVIMGKDVVKYSAKELHFKIPELESLRHEVSYKAGTNKLSLMMEFRTRQLSYTVTMKNVKNNRRYSYIGKWIETIPTGKYSIEVTFIGSSTPD